MSYRQRRCKCIRFLIRNKNMTDFQSTLRNARLLIFDLGGVLIDIDVAASVRAFEKLGIKDINRYVSQSHAVGGGFFADFERGLISKDELFDNIRRMSGINTLTDNEITYAWNAMLGSFVKERIEVVERMKQTHETALLSNTNVLHYEQFNSQVPGYSSLNELFDKTWYSHEMHLSKPDPEIYRAVLAAHGCRPEDALFFDDSQRNLDGAESVGMKTCLVTAERGIVEILR